MYAIFEVSGLVLVKIGPFVQEVQEGDGNKTDFLRVYGEYRTNSITHLRT